MKSIARCVEVKTGVSFPQICGSVCTPRNVLSADPVIHLLFCAVGGGGARGHVLDRACPLALLTNSAAAGADGLRAAGDQRGGSEEGGPVPGGG